MSLRFLDRFEETLISALMALAVLIIFVAVLHRFTISFAADLIGWSRAHDYPAVQAFARSAFKAINGIRLTWAQEATIYLFIWMAKFGAAYGVRIGIHVGVDILVEQLSPRARRPVTLTAFAACILFTALVAWFGANFVWLVAINGQTSPDLEIKMWIVYLAVPAGSALMCFRFIQATWLYATTGFIAHHDHGAVAGLEREAKDLSDGGHA